MNWSTHWHKHIEENIFLLQDFGLGRISSQVFFFGTCSFCCTFESQPVMLAVLQAACGSRGYQSTCLCSAIVSAIHFISGSFSRAFSIYLYKGTPQYILNCWGPLPAYVLSVLRSKQGLRAAVPSQNLLGIVKGAARLQTGVPCSCGLLWTCSAHRPCLVHSEQKNRKGFVGISLFD